jgi:hypothetical protein
VSYPVEKTAVFHVEKKVENVLEWKGLVLISLPTMFQPGFEHGLLVIRGCAGYACAGPVNPWT